MERLDIALVELYKDRYVNGIQKWGKMEGYDAWWSGLSRSECRTVMEAISERLTDMDGYFVHNENRNSRMPKDFAAFLPAYDELLIGYKSRHHSIEPEHCHHAFNNFGTFRPVILWQQKITGKWSRQNLSTTFFAEAASDAALEKAHERYKRFLT